MCMGKLSVGHGIEIRAACHHERFMRGASCMLPGTQNDLSPRLISACYVVSHVI